MTWEVALIGATVAAASATAYTQYESARVQSKAGRLAAGLRREQIGVERETLALQTREQEVERRRRLSVNEANGRAVAAGFGLDPYGGGSLSALQADNERAAAGDIGAIRLLGSSRAYQLGVQDLSAAWEQDAYTAVGRNAWIRPAGTLFQAGMSIYRNYSGAGFGGGGGGAPGDNAITVPATQVGPNGRLAGPV